MLKKLSGVKIKAIAACVPQSCLGILEYAPNLITAKEVKRFVKGTGFANLRIAKEDVTTADLCLSAAEKIFSEQNINKQDIDGLIFVSQTPNWYLPATSHYLQDKLGLCDSVVCFDINEGCSGYIQGLYLASTLIKAQQCKNVLVLAGDTISKLTDPEDRATRLIFGDAGTATVIGSGDKAIFFNITTYGAQYSAIITPNSRHKEDTSQNNSFLKLDGMSIMNFTLNEVPQNINNLLQYTNTDRHDVDLYLCHQANKLILNTLATKLDIAADRLPFTASDVGNTSSASIPLMLAQERYKGLAKALLCGFGVGLACGSCLTDLTETKILDVIEYE